MEQNLPNRPYNVRPETLEIYAERLETIGYSANSRRNYVKALRRFTEWLRPQQLSNLQQAEVNASLTKMASELDISESYHNLLANAIQLYYVVVEGRSKSSYNLPRRKNIALPPKILEQPEIQRMIRASPNTKQKCMLLLLYGLGLRVGELLALRRSDLDLKEKLLGVIRNGGSQICELALPDKLITTLQVYLVESNPQTYLFEGRKEGEPLGERSLQMGIKHISKMAKIDRQVTPSMLRHSYAVHLLEGGTDVSQLQEIMGHKSLRSPNAYAKMARMRLPDSPLEGMEI